MPDVITEAEQKAIINFRGKVTKCPPRTFAIDAAEPESWRKTINAQWTQCHRQGANNRRAQEAAERRERIIADAPRMTIMELAKRENVSRKTISHILSQAGVQAKPQREVRASLEMLRDLAERASVDEIAEATGYSPKTVRNRLAEMKVRAAG